VHDIGEADGRAFLIMELMEGQILERLINGHPLQLDRLLDVAIDVSDALEAAHSKGILHAKLLLCRRRRQEKRYGRSAAFLGHGLSRFRGAERRPGV
jgi:hypothetical protein